MSNTAELSEQEKVEQWREREVLRIYPDIDPDQARKLAQNDDPRMLEKVIELKQRGCRTNLVFEIVS